MIIAVPVINGSDKYFINNAYVDYISKAGLEPLLVTTSNNIADIERISDGLLLPGGVDIEPTFYGEDNISSNNVDPDRDDFERRLLHRFVNAGKPVFGICRGFQLIVREFIRANADAVSGISYYQHVPEHSLVGARNAPRNVPTHKVMARVSKLYGNADGNEDRFIFVNSMHHQALVAMPNNFSITVDDDNKLSCLALTNFGLDTNSKNFIVEAVEVLMSGTKLRGVQWHPEELNDTSLLTTFFAGDENNGERNDLQV